MWLKMYFQAHGDHQPPPFVVSTQTPKQMPRRCPLGCVRQGASSSPSKWAPKWIKGSTGGKQINFVKNYPRPLGVPKEVVLAYFEPVLPRSRPPNIPKMPSKWAIWGPQK